MRRAAGPPSPKRAEVDARPQWRRGERRGLSGLCKPRRHSRLLVKPLELKEDSGIAERSALALVARAPEELALLVLAHLLAPLLDHASQEPTSADWLKGRG